MSLKIQTLPDDNPWPFLMANLGKKEKKNTMYMLSFYLSSYTCFVPKLELSEAKNKK